MFSLIKLVFRELEIYREVLLFKKLFIVIIKADMLFVRFPKSSGPNNFSIIVFKFYNEFHNPFL